MEQQEANAVQLPTTPEAISAMLSAMYIEDADFRAAFDKDPKAAIAKITGQKMAADAEVVVHRNEEKRWHITLPSQQAMGLMSDQEISGVSGGVAAGPGSFFRCIAAPLLISAGLCECCSGSGDSGGSGISQEDATAAHDAFTGLMDAYARLFSAAASIGRGGSGG